MYEKNVTVAEATEQVTRMARRLGLLYHFAAEVLVERLGDEEAREILHEIVWRYGCEAGVAARTKVNELGLASVAENFNKGSDLPKYGWQADTVVCDDGKTRGRVSHCPIAEVFKEKGSQQMGRLYCVVDEAKYHAYNGSKCRHLKNVLDGDDCCLFDIEEQT